MRDKYIHMTSKQLKQERIKKERYEKKLKKSVAKELANNNKPVKTRDPFLDTYNLCGRDIESNKAKMNIVNVGRIRGNPRIERNKLLHNFIITDVPHFLFKSV